MDLYRSVMRPVLFRMPADTAHDLARVFLRSPIAPVLLHQRNLAGPRLACDLAGIRLASPIGLAPGLDKDADLLPALQHLGFGYVVVGSITAEPRVGNAKPRLVRYRDRQSISNSMGLPNVGINRAVERLRTQRVSGTAVLGSIAGFSPEEILSCVDKLEPVVAAVEIGLVCPNVTDSERMQERESFNALVRELARRTSKPVFMKLAPFHNREDADRTFRMMDECVRAGIAGISVSGGRHITEPLLSTGSGSLSGRDVFADSLRVVRAVAEHAKGALVIRGSGGVWSGNDAMRMLAAGATAIEIYSAFIFQGPRVARRMNAEILDLLDEQGQFSVRRPSRAPLGVDEDVPLP